MAKAIKAHPTFIKNLKSSFPLQFHLKPKDPAHDLSFTGQFKSMLKFGMGSSQYYSTITKFQQGLVDQDLKALAQVLEPTLYNQISHSLYLLSTHGYKFAYITPGPDPESEGMFSAIKRVIPYPKKPKPITPTHEILPPKSIVRLNQRQIRGYFRERFLDNS